MMEHEDQSGLRSQQELLAFGERFDALVAEGKLGQAERMLEGASALPQDVVVSLRAMLKLRSALQNGWELVRGQPLPVSREGVEAGKLALLQVEALDPTDSEVLKLRAHVAKAVQEAERVVWVGDPAALIGGAVAAMGACTAALASLWLLPLAAIYVLSLPGYLAWAQGPKLERFRAAHQGQINGMMELLAAMALLATDTGHLYLDGLIGFFTRMVFLGPFLPVMAWMAWRDRSAPAA